MQLSAIIADERGKTARAETEVEEEERQTQKLTDALTATEQQKATAEQHASEALYSLRVAKVRSEELVASKHDLETQLTRTGAELERKAEELKIAHKDFE